MIWYTKKLIHGNLVDWRDEFITVLWIRIRDPVLCEPWIRDPGWVKNHEPDPGSGPGSYFESLKNIFLVKIIFNSLMRIRDPG
jgi:hypothetical protein